ncbi:MAG: tyrosine-type recombinase/integrase [Nitrososphaeraceae archaeon]
MPNKSAATAVSSLKTSKRTKIETARLTDSMTISRPEESRALDKYIKNIRAMSKRTAHEYHLRLIGFQDFVIRSYKTTLDGIIRRINEGSEDPYEILSSYVAYMQTNYNISTLTLKQRIVTVKNFFEYYDVDISPRKFKLKVKIPKVIRKSKEALSKEDIINILNACSEIRLKTYVMLLAGTGLGAVEALSIRIKDLNLQPRPAKIFVRGEYTKTKTDRYVFLTEEVLNQLKQWLDYKHRTRRVCHKDNHTGKTISEYITPQRNDNDLVFAVYQDRNHPNPNAIYFDLVKSFGKTLDRIGKGLREESNNNRRRQITLHSFRRFVKTTISDLGYSDFSEWFIGHAGSTYWTKKDSEKAEIFSKVEPYLTFLNIPELQRQGADIQTKVEELEDLNQSLRNRDKMKDDAIAQLSDQLMALTARMQEFERKQQPYVS